MDGIGYRIKLTMMENEEVKMTDAYTQDARRSKLGTATSQLYDSLLHIVSNTSRC